MKLKLTLVAGTEHDDVAVTVDSTATVGQVAERLRISHPRVRPNVAPGPSLCLRVAPGRAGERVVAPTLTMGEAGIRSGDSITLTTASGGRDTCAGVAATLEVINGPDAGKSFDVTSGTTRIGRDRDCDVRLNDPLISKRHAKLIVGDGAEVVDDNSANGVSVGGDLVQRAPIRSGEVFALGDTEIRVRVHSTAAAASGLGGSSVEFNRSPRLDPTFVGPELKAPEPPDKPQPPRFQLATLVAPLLMGLVLYVVTRNVLSIAFIALSPFMTVGMYFENRRQTKKSIEQMRKDYRAALRDLAVQLQYAAELERNGRRAEHPAVDEVVAGVEAASPLLWTRRPEHDRFGEVRFGLGSQPSRTTVEMPERNNTLPELWKELHDVVGQFSTIERVPVVAALAECGNVGVAGPPKTANPMAAALVTQFAGLHSPAELVIASITSSASVDRWRWLKWLPHAGSEYSPIAGEHLVAAPRPLAQLVAELEQLVADRSGDDQRDGVYLPTVLVIVEDDAALDRARLVQLAERGPGVGVHFLWVSPSQERLPAACRSYVVAEPGTEFGHSGFVPGGVGVDDLELDPIDIERAAAVASALSPVSDAGALLDDESDVPRSVSFLALTGNEFADSTIDIIEQWRGHHSLPEPEAPKLKRDNTLRALVGQSATDRFYLDLRRQGPHALVGGTTGAGKSEFLQSWILGMATAHSSARVNFLFVDYKGGAAFADCVKLPHCVGLVTDLSPHLVRRALISLRAELTRREHILNRKRAKDLLELERSRDPETPPSLVIIVDEFAALVGEVPEFVDGVVDVAQRGRSLGLHLILATQRPAGVIKDNLRANTNLRVALRMADEDDSTDVVGDPIAGTFDPGIPGRGIAKTGPGRLALFQSAYVGGHTSEEPPAPSIDVHEFPFGLGEPWDAPVETEDRSGPDGPNDIARIVNNVIAADRQVGLPVPVKPWLPDLYDTYQLEELDSPRTDTSLVFGVIDRPKEQTQPVVAFEPDQHKHMAVYGTGGAGKSVFLRSLAIAAGRSSARGGPCHVYGLDFGARGLSMLEPLPHVGAVVNGDDAERTLRLMKWLRQVVDERLESFKTVNASTIVNYRSLADRPDEPRILLLLDNFGAFRTQYEIARPGNPYEILESLMADGPGVGVHLVATADVANAFPNGFKSGIQRELVLRMPNENDLLMLGVKPDVFGEDSPPGRGFIGDDEVQVGVIKGDPNVANQAREVKRLARAFDRQGVGRAPAIARLAERVPFNSVAQQQGQRPVLGVWDESLGALGFDPAGLFIVSGPPRSGKTTTVVTMLRSLDQVGHGGQRVLIAPRRSDLVGARSWDVVVSDPAEVGERADALAAALAEGRGDLENLVVVVQGLGDFVNGPADEPLNRLLRASRANGAFVVFDGEPAEFNGSYGLVGTVKLDRTGIVMQPDMAHGDLVLGTDFPRVNRTDFPAGRGLFAANGHVYRVQVLEPTSDG